MIGLDSRVRLGARSVTVGSLLLFVGLSYATLAVAGAFTRIDSWYDALVKPAWTPPGWLIGIVWWTLYTLIGASAAVAWSGSRERVTNAVFVGALGTNLVLNALWSLLFFTLHWVTIALADIVLLFLSVATLAFVSFRRDRLAGYLLLPYLAWVGLAATLTFEIWRLNG